MYPKSPTASRESQAIFGAKQNAPITPPDEGGGTNGYPQATYKGLPTRKDPQPPLSSTL